MQSTYTRSTTLGVFVLMVGSFLAGCQSGEDGAGAGARQAAGMISGVVVYRERMALPADATIVVHLEDVSRADAPAEVIASQTIAANGRQVPIPFELDFASERIEPARRYALRAEIRAAGGELMFTTTTSQAVLEPGATNEGIEILLQRARGADGSATGAGSREATGSLTAAAPEVGRTSVFDCPSGESFTVRTGPGEVALWAPESVGGQYVVLGMTEAASGARYADGDTVYWNKGEVATLEIAGRTFTDCRSNPSKVPWADAVRRGATFRALGNEPAWTLEILPERLVLTMDLGETRTELPFGAPLVEGAETTYRADDGDQTIIAVVARRACTDSMSGDPFEATATVTVRGQMLRGCGRFL